MFKLLSLSLLETYDSTNPQVMIAEMERHMLEFYLRQHKFLQTRSPVDALNYNHQVFCISPIIVVSPFKKEKIQRVESVTENDGERKMGEVVEVGPSSKYLGFLT